MESYYFNKYFCLNIKLKEKKKQREEGIRKKILINRKKHLIH